MLSYVQYKNAVLQELQDQMTAQQYEEQVLNRLSVVEAIIMDEYDRPSLDRPSPSVVVGMITEEFGIY